jgi:phosphatidylinositol-3,4,5-trisphosphate 3-phosphatase/dual-specificity protein phosphatase PTEN
MDILRKLVSGKKNRYKDKEYNLDLTYITPRIIAMSIPGQGVHKVYRNSIDSVSSFLNERHRGFYKILNLSGMKYDYKKFDNKVFDYPWQDHYPPPIELLFKACEEIHNWLYLHEKNVVIVHCRAGKGRTGTLICCYLMYCQRLFHPDDALNYYKHKRFSVGGGVTQPSQKRYVRYFSEIFDGHIKSPNILQLRYIKMFTAPHMASNSCRPIIELMSNKQKVFHNKKANRDNQCVLYNNTEEKKVHELALANSEVMLCGDVDCFLTHWGRLKIKKICRFSFNTAFHEPETSLELKKDQLDPDTFKNNKKVDDDFSIEISFDARKCGCHNRMTVAERCSECRRMIRLEEGEKWNEIQRILMERIKADPKVMLFGDEEDDIDYVINTVIQGSCSLSEGSND